MTFPPIFPRRKGVTILRTVHLSAQARTRASLAAARAQLANLEALIARLEDDVMEPAAHAALMAQAVHTAHLLDERMKGLRAALAGTEG